MPPREWRLRMEDILEAIEAVMEYTDGMTFESFSADRRTVHAVERNLTVIGEAACHIPEEVQVRYPHVPWRRMRGMRNVVVHDYPGVDLLILWETTRGSLPPLVPLLREILEAEP